MSDKELKKQKALQSAALRSLLNFYGESCTRFSFRVRQT